MAQSVTNRLKYLALNAYISGGSTAPDLRLGLLKTCAGMTNVPDLNTVAEMEAHADFAELTGASGYARVALTGEAVTEVDGSDWAAFDVNDAEFGALGTGGTIVGWFLYEHHDNGDDSLNILVAIGDLASTPTNGGTVTVNIADILRAL